MMRRALRPLRRALSSCSASELAVDVGQPTSATHPGLVGAAEATPGVPAAEYGDRREALAASLARKGLAGAVVAAAPQAFYPGCAIPYGYRPDGDFFYLTGVVSQPAALAVSAGAGEERALFLPPDDANDLAWHGPRLTPSTATAAGLGASLAARPARELPAAAAALAARGAVAWDAGREGGAHVARELAAAPHASLRPLVHALRWKKSAAEAQRMRLAARAGEGALRACIAAAVPGAMEYEAGAAYEYGAKKQGAQRLAYPPVVAGGLRANYIHYSRMDQPLQAGELILVDAGLELHGYVCDITRTWPVSGRYSTAQRRVYDAVLRAHRECLAATRPGTTLRELHNLSVRALCRELADLLGTSAHELQRGGYRRFYPHSVGHWLGIDTHDCGTVSIDVTLEPGAVLTLEPGLYLPDCHTVPAELRNIGVRIEDDVLVTETGAEVLSDGLPVCPDATEELVGELQAGGVAAALGLR